MSLNIGMHVLNVPPPKKPAQEAGSRTYGIVGWSAEKEYCYCIRANKAYLERLETSDVDMHDTVRALSGRYWKFGEVFVQETPSDASARNNEHYVIWKADEGGYFISKEVNGMSSRVAWLKGDESTGPQSVVYAPYWANTTRHDVTFEDFACMSSIAFYEELLNKTLNKGVQLKAEVEAARTGHEDKRKSAEEKHQHDGDGEVKRGGWAEKAATMVELVEAKDWDAVISTTTTWKSSHVIDKIMKTRQQDAENKAHKQKRDH